ncbi:cytochrome P450 2J6-like [Uloborus diversus]|uniref:cytochrome P450 2J6-like n=1 Tax=Uloborus diversus TaxID=327109 RepID=UPI00240A7E7D|nr:cytochrome P450 2J6-like [Uloborus diversus]
MDLLEFVPLFDELIWMRRKKNLPPGPYALPIFGYLPFLGSEAYRTLYNLSQKYGPIFSLYLGRKLVIVLNNYDVVKEALSNVNIMDRPEHPPNHLLPDSINMAISSGEIWKEQKLFFIQTIRKLGMGKQEMERLIQEELQQFCREIENGKGSPINLGPLLMTSVSNNIFALLTGRKLNYTDKDRLFLNDSLALMTLYFRPTRIHAFFPSVKSWMAKLKIWGYDEVRSQMLKLSEFINGQIEEHKNSSNCGSSNYIDEFLAHMNEHNSTTFTERMLRGNIQSLFGAGSTPARATIEWALVCMVLYPDIQKVVHEELDSVIGKERFPAWNDFKTLPYTTAVMYEVMRKCTIIPISMLRTNRTKCRIGGYDVPEGSIIMTNIWGVHHDSKVWRDPFTFRPERFLQNGDVVKPSEFIPFSYGRRKCPGEEMALMEVFLYFTTLMQRYNIEPPAENVSCYKKVLGIANMAIPDNICLKLRE